MVGLDGERHACGAVVKHVVTEKVERFVTPDDETMYNMLKVLNSIESRLKVIQKALDV